ncbi:MAG: CDP-diacylglycerol--glycerol-3-phosphate 3-phosphatidyltransferase [Thermoanaerobaculia bacterium]|nr:CDP-diacylglycerol--glycerol-3-phosphate 3-phosphatidyltransferase [Thermoanaerobaculia bacterium]
MINLPNVLSLSRILLVPILVVVLLTEYEDKELIGLGLFLVAAFTDFLDGFIARRRKQVTRLGQLLDPAADKILTSAAFISLVGLGVTPAWMVVVIVAREFAVSALRSVAALQDLAISASIAGKLKTVVQIVAISLAIVYEHLGDFERLAGISLWVAVLVTLYSGLEYFFKFGKMVILEPKGTDA